jgi:hypothetical protein
MFDMLIKIARLQPYIARLARACSKVYRQVRVEVLHFDIVVEIQDVDRSIPER